jgi:hypothetical protein
MRFSILFPVLFSLILADCPDQPLVETCLRTGVAGVLLCGNQDACLCPQLKNAAACFKPCAAEPVSINATAVINAEANKRCAGTGNSPFDINGLIAAATPPNETLSLKNFTEPPATNTNTTSPPSTKSLGTQQVVGYGGVGILVALMTLSLQ